MVWQLQSADELRASACSRWPIPNSGLSLKTPQDALGRTVSFSHFWPFSLRRSRDCQNWKVLRDIWSESFVRGASGDSEEGGGLAEVAQLE